MVIKKYDKVNKFKAYFDTETGNYMRTGVLENGVDTNEDPFMTNYPELIDVGVMGHCVHGKSGLCIKSGVQCYQNGLGVTEPNMSLEDFKKIVEESRGRTFQLALGGRGDVDEHENFEELLAYCRENNIVPNFTTSGLGMTKEKADICKRYCGAVAVSMYSRLEPVPMIAMRKCEKGEKPKVYKNKDAIPVKFTFGDFFDNCRFDGPRYIINGKEYDWLEYHHLEESDLNGRVVLFKVYDEEHRQVNYTFRAIKYLLDAGVKTNIHYVLGKNTIDEAIIRLRNNGFPKGINAVIFLMHKPVGLGSSDNVLNIEDEKVKEFFELIDSRKFPFKIGFDSCSVPAILNKTKSIMHESIDTCEGGRWSAYITSDMKMLPCSFDNQEQRWAYDLKGSNIESAWQSEQFEDFRAHFKKSCSKCKDRKFCMGGCPIRREIVMCDRKSKHLYESNYGKGENK